jgi:hypothetical protein
MIRNQSISVREGQKIPFFRPGDSGPQISSASDMNVIVKTLNALANAKVIRGGADKFSLTDENALIQIEDPRFAGAQQSSGGGGGSSTDPARILSAYWTLDEASGSTRIDKIAGYGLKITAGSDTHTSAPGKFGNALDIGNALQGNCSFDTFVVDTVPALRCNGAGFSIFGWFKILTSDSGSLLLELSFNNCYTATGSAANIQMEIGNTIDPILNFQFTDFNQNSNVNGSGTTTSVDASGLAGGITTGVWYFFHLFYDASASVFSSVGSYLFNGTIAAGANVSGTCGLSINAGAPLYAAGLVGAPAFGACGWGNMIFSVVAPLPEVLFDEIGVCTGRCLRKNEIDYLYNSGTGRTWPLGNFPSD